MVVNPVVFWLEVAVVVVLVDIIVEVSLVSVGIGRVVVVLVDIIVEVVLVSVGIGRVVVVVV